MEEGDSGGDIAGGGGAAAAAAAAAQYLVSNISNLPKTRSLLLASLLTVYPTLQLSLSQLEELKVLTLLPSDNSEEDQLCQWSWYRIRAVVLDGANVDQSTPSNATSATTAAAITPITETAIPDPISIPNMTVLPPPSKFALARTSILLKHARLILLDMRANSTFPRTVHDFDANWGTEAVNQSVTLKPYQLRQFLSMHLHLVYTLGGDEEERLFWHLARVEAFLSGKPPAVAELREPWIRLLRYLCESRLTFPSYKNFKSGPVFGQFKALIKLDTPPDYFDPLEQCGIIRPNDTAFIDYARAEACLQALGVEVVSSPPPLAVGHNLVRGEENVPARVIAEDKSLADHARISFIETVPGSDFQAYFDLTRALFLDIWRGMEIFPESVTEFHTRAASVIGRVTTSTESDLEARSNRLLLFITMHLNAVHCAGATQFPNQLVWDKKRVYQILCAPTAVCAMEFLDLAPVRLVEYLCATWTYAPKLIPQMSSSRGLKWKEFNSFLGNEAATAEEDLFNMLREANIFSQQGFDKAAATAWLARNKRVRAPLPGTALEPTLEGDFNTLLDLARRFLRKLVDLNKNNRVWPSSTVHELKARMKLLQTNSTTLLQFMVLQMNVCHVVRLNGKACAVWDTTLGRIPALARGAALEPAEHRFVRCLVQSSGTREEEGEDEPHMFESIASINKIWYKFNAFVELDRDAVFARLEREGIFSTAAASAASPRFNLEHARAWLKGGQAEGGKEKKVDFDAVLLAGKTLLRAWEGKELPPTITDFNERASALELGPSPTHLFILLSQHLHLVRRSGGGEQGALEWRKDRIQAVLEDRAKLGTAWFRFLHYMCENEAHLQQCNTYAELVRAFSSEFNLLLGCDPDAFFKVLERNGVVSQTAEPCFNVQVARSWLEKTRPIMNAAAGIAALSLECKTVFIDQASALERFCLLDNTTGFGPVAAIRLMHLSNMEVNLVQVALSEALVYVFDVVALGLTQVCQALHCLLESSTTVKLFYDLYQDGGVLLKEHVTSWENVLDTQLLSEHMTGHMQLGLLETCQLFAGSNELEAENLGRVSKLRPIDASVVKVAAKEALRLFRCWPGINKAFPTQLERFIDASSARIRNVTSNAVQRRCVGFDNAQHKLSSLELLDTSALVEKEGRGHMPLRPSAAIVDDLLDILPTRLRDALEPHKHDLVEICLDKGHAPYCHVYGQRQRVLLGDGEEDIASIVDKLGGSEDQGRIRATTTAGQLHRILVLRSNMGALTGLTLRVGRSPVPDLAMSLQDILLGEGNTAASVLFIGPRNSGKTTMLRDVARILSQQGSTSVCILDVDNEMGGDADVPHACVGDARRVMIAKPKSGARNQFASILVECLQNHCSTARGGGGGSVIVDGLEGGLGALESCLRASRRHGTRLLASMAIEDYRARETMTTTGLLSEQVDFLVELQSTTEFRVSASAARAGKFPAQIRYWNPQAHAGQLSFDITPCNN